MSCRILVKPLSWIQKVKAAQVFAFWKKLFGAYIFLLENETSVFIWKICEPESV